MIRRILCILPALCLGTACGLAGPTTPTPDSPAPTGPVHYTAIGASDAIGIGASVHCLPFVACPNGTGYVQLIAKRLKSAGKTVTLLNLGLPGSVLSPEIQAIGNAVGHDTLTNFLDNEAPFVSQDSTLVTVFAGGNDVNIIGAALQVGLGGADPVGYFQARTQNFRRDLRALMSVIKQRAPTARVVVLNLPNLAALPYAAGYSLQQRRALQEVAVTFSAAINSLRSDGALIIDVMCDPGFYQAGMYSGDGFHPNDSGYARMADAAYPVASGGPAGAPSLSCSQMTLY
jgi:lysophospholipase L1-like esterase